MHQFIKNEKMFRAFVENSAELTILTDKDGNVVFVGPQCEAITGYPASRFLDQTFFDILHPDDAKACEETWGATIFVGRRLEGLEYRIIDANGVTKWVSHCAGSIFVDGQYLGMQNSIQDITRQKNAELRLVESKQFNDMILNASPDAIYVYDICQNTNVYSNDGIRRVLGYSVSDIQAFGTNLIKGLMHPDDFEVYVNHTLPAYQHLLDDEFVQHKYRMKHRDGHWCWLMSKETIFQRSADGAALQIFGLISDVSKQVEDEEHLRAAHLAMEASENKYRRLFENMSSAFALHEIVTDAQGIPVDYVFLEVNDEFEKMTGLRRENILGARVTSAIPGIEKDPADWIGKYGKVALGGDTLRLIQYAEPLAKWFAIVVYAPIERQFATIFMDITEQKKLEVQLIESQKMKAIGQLAGGIAHDFNNQLAGIVGYADLLRETSDSGSDAALYAEKILLSTKRAADLTAQLLAFARKGKYLSVPVDLRELVGETIDILSHTIDRRIKISQTLTSDVPIVMGDPSQLQNAIMNLALNARDAMAGGGELHFSTKVLVLDSEYIHAHSLDVRAGQFVELCVTDTGCGMDAATQSRIFEPFFTTKSDQKGTGMGLAATWGTVRNHGGVIEVYSEPGKGTTMRILLPQETHTTGVSAENDVMSAQTAARKVLLVDDEPIVIETCSLMLKKLGYEVIACGDGAAAVKIFEQQANEIDLVILDMVMPVMDGNETYRLMRQLRHDVRVLLCSGYSLDGAAQEMLNDGVDGFIQKPFRMQSLAEKLAELNV